MDDVVLRDRKRLTVFVGDYGSGKTEVALNFALALRRYEQRVKIIDLDIVNPYFRTREAAGVLLAAGIELIAPSGEQTWADLPIILPSVAGAVHDASASVVLDVGGEAAGSRVLGSLFESSDEIEYDLLVVLNVNRPFTGDVESAESVLRKIEGASGLQVTGIVSNTHLLDKTTPEMVLAGYNVAESLAKRLAVNVRFVSVEKSVAKELDRSSFSAPIFALTRHVLLPWELSGTTTAG
nr:hypothetical protein [Bacillota bacterium]